MRTVVVVVDVPITANGINDNTRTVEDAKETNLELTSLDYYKVGFIKILHKKIDEHCLIHNLSSSHLIHLHHFSALYAIPRIAPGTRDNVCAHQRLT